MECNFKIGPQVGYHYARDTHLLLQDSYEGHYIRTGGYTPAKQITLAVRRVDDGSVQIETEIVQSYKSGAVRETSGGLVIPAEHVPALIAALTESRKKEPA
jgi:hypothetical protein